MRARGSKVSSALPGVSEVDFSFAISAIDGLLSCRRLGGFGVGAGGAAGASLSRSSSASDSEIPAGGASARGFSRAGAGAAAAEMDWGPSLLPGLTSVGLGAAAVSSKMSSSSDITGDEDGGAGGEEKRGFKVGNGGRLEGAGALAGGAAVALAFCIRPCAVFKVASTCFGIRGFCRKKFSPSLRFPLGVWPWTAMVSEVLLAAAMRALCSTQPAP